MRLGLGALTVVLLVTATARAQPEPSAPAPWEEGVAEADRQRALALFLEGNELFQRSEYARAADKYRAALEHWDHPRVHGNLATALIYLETPLEAYDHIERALAYGAKPFEPHVYQQLLTNKKLLLGQLATVEIQCEAEGAEVAIDGEDMFVGPGSKTILLTARPHQLVARRAEYLTFTQKFTPLGGQITRIRIELVPLEQAARYERRWARWKPWAVVGGGVLVAAVGIPLRGASLSARDQYEAEVAALCPSGCRPDTLPGSVLDLEQRSARYNRFEVAAYTAGAAVALTGAVMVYLNRERRIELHESGERITAAPWLSRDEAGLAVRVSF